jgi:hypothetical protein
MKIAKTREKVIKYNKTFLPKKRDVKMLEILGWSISSNVGHLTETFKMYHPSIQAVLRYVESSNLHSGPSKTD